MTRQATARPADEVARALIGPEEYTVLDAQESPEGVLTVSVIRTRPEAPCPGCGVFSGRVKSYRASTVVDAPAQGRPCRLAVTKRAFRCDTPGCERSSFTEATDALPVRARVTERCRDAMGRAGRDRATAGVAAEYGVSWIDSLDEAEKALVAVVRHSSSRPRPGATRRRARLLML